MISWLTDWAAWGYALVGAVIVIGWLEIRDRRARR